MKRALIPLVAALLFGCASPNVQPGDGPAATAESSEQQSPGGEPTGTPSERAPAGFHDKYVYDDGLQVEVIRIVVGHFTARDVAPTAEDEMKGHPYAKFTVRVKNGSKTTVALASSATVTYGPDGDQAKESYLLDSDSGLSGKLIPGKSRSTVSVYLVPDKYWADVVMEFTPDFEHTSAVFSGSIK